MTDDAGGEGRRPGWLPAWTAEVLLAAAAAVAVAAVHASVFPDLSVNHDEGVYLQQAALLLDGQLVLRAGDLADAVRPWFFVQDGGELYPKYTPVTAAVFAAGKLLAGSYAAALPAVAFANVLLAVLIVQAAFDRRTGLVAGALVAASPLFLVTSATFLSYAPATALNLLFALGYLRAVRRESLRWAALAGFAVGLAFFARPYTAVLFAAPFVAHALLATVGAWRFRDRAALGVVVRRNAVVAALGLAFVAVALAYNWRLTGDPLVFPYQAFAPQDGVGFGERRILGHEVDYTVGLGLWANARVLRVLATDWFVAPPLGALLAVGGAVAVLARLHERWWGRSLPALLPARSLSDDGVRALLLGVALSVVAGNVAFWGNLNVLGNPIVAGDGLIASLGPFYHFDLLLPLSAFAAHAALLGADRVRGAVVARTDRRHATAVAIAALLVVAPLAAADAGAVDDRLDRNAATAERLDRAYGPFADRSFDRALVFLPTPYGDWLNHPLQRLRNDPDLDGPVVYALDRDAEGNLAVVDAYPDRRLYRYTYRGTWSADPRSRVTPKLQRLRVVEGERLRVRTTLGVPEGSTVSSVRLEADDRAVTYEPVGASDGATTVEWLVGPDAARVVSGATGPETLAIDGETEVSLAVTLLQPGGATLTYRQDLAFAVGPDGVRALWPAETRVCRLTPDCGLEGTYLPGHPDEHVEGVAVNASVRPVTDAR